MKYIKLFNSNNLLEDNFLSKRSHDINESIEDQLFRKVQHDEETIFLRRHKLLDMSEDDKSKIEKIFFNGITSITSTFQSSDQAKKTLETPVIKWIKLQYPIFSIIIARFDDDWWKIHAGEGIYICDGFDGIQEWMNIIWKKSKYGELYYINEGSSLSDFIVNNLGGKFICSNINEDDYSELITDSEDRFDEVTDGDIEYLEKLLINSGNNVSNFEITTALTDSDKKSSVMFYVYDDFPIQDGLIIFYKFYDDWWIVEFSLESDCSYWVLDGKDGLEELFRKSNKT